MFCKRRSAIKYVLAAVLVSVLYGEWIIYYMQSFYWNNLQCDDNDNTCTRILFIADPQIQGDLAAPPPFNYLFSWDSDRYTKATFSVVLNFFRPHILIYLGDLTDEGSIASKAEFHSYVKRLFHIFDVNYPVVQVWLPGDNDIGGENEPIKNDKLIEFSKAFQQPDVITFRNISVYKVNKITQTMPKIPEDITEDSNFKMVVSHYPITNSLSFARKVMNDIHPDIFFCAHNHDSKYVEQSINLNHKFVHPINYNDEVLEISILEDKIYEIFVPTCSYRMGTPNIGFGAAILENNNQNMQYTVLWSPTRFPTLFFYLFIISALLVYVLIFCVARLIIFGNTNKITTLRSTYKIPLLESS